MESKVFEKLIKLQNNSYCAYSDYPVAAVLIDSDDKEFYGVNIENASYGLTICAERNAIGNAITNGSKYFKEIHIICGRNKKTFGVPCGACRQVLVEFCKKDMPVIVWNCEGKSKRYTVEELIPYSFDNEFFGKE